jgi:hypothetical protein
MEIRFNDKDYAIIWTCFEHVKATGLSGASS